MCSACGSRCTSRNACVRRGELLVDARLFLVGERVRHLDDHHPVEQRLVLRLLQELAELGEVGVREDRLVEVDQREARHLDVLFLRQRQQQVEELALDLEDLDHLEHAAARREHRAATRTRRAGRPRRRTPRPSKDRPSRPGRRCRRWSGRAARRCPRRCGRLPR